MTTAAKPTNTTDTRPLHARTYDCGGAELSWGAMIALLGCDPEDDRLVVLACLRRGEWATFTTDDADDLEICRLR